MKIEVHLQGGLRKIIDITPGATVGATVGVNVRNQDGTLWVPPATGGDKPVSITSWELILNIPPNVAALAAFSGTGLYTITGPGTSVGRSVSGTAGRIGVTNGDGVAGNPTVDLVPVADTGIGADLVKITVDNWGRVEGTEAAGLGDLDDVDLTTTPPEAGDALVYAGAVWKPGSVDTAVPFFVPDGQSYTVAANKQALFTLPIELDGDASLVLDGALVEVS